MPGTGEIVGYMPQRRGPNSKYDWDVIADGQIRKMTRHIDFEPSVEGFRATVHAHAKQVNMAVRTRSAWEEKTDGERNKVLYVQFFPDFPHGQR